MAQDIDKRQLLVEHPVGSVNVIKKYGEKISTITEGVGALFENLPDGIDEESILIKGPVQRADVENKNGRIYPYKILQREAVRLNEIITQTGGVLGELDHPDISTIQLGKVPVCVRKLWWEGKNLMAIAEILDPKYNPNAGIAYSIIKAGLPLGISSRGLGSLSYVDGINVVQEDFEMVCWDLVSDPSTHSAYMRKIPVKKINEQIKEAQEAADSVGLKTKDSLRLNSLINRIVWGS